MKSRELIGGMIAGSILGVGVGYMMRPKNKAMSMVRKGMKMFK